MTIKFGEGLKNYEDKRKALAQAVQEGASEEVQAQAFGEMFDAMTKDIRDEVVKTMTDANHDSGVLNARGFNTLTNKEIKFYNELTTDVGYKDETLIPETIINRVFEDLEKEHPFLSTIKIETMGLRTRIIEADPKGQVVWGKIFGEIRGQLDAVFTEKDLKLGKATCYVVVPKDLKDAGVTWIDAFVRAQIREAYAVAFELMAISGRGSHKDEPVGLMMDIDPEDGAVKDKVSAGTLTFANPETSIKELTGALSKLSLVSKDGKKNYRKVKGEVFMAVNPVNALYLESVFTKVTENNVYVTAIPFGVKVVENEFVPADKVLIYIGKNYTLGVGGDKIVREFKETLAIEDCDLYTAKQFAYGEPKDNSSAFVYDLAIDGMPSIEDLDQA